MSQIRSNGIPTVSALPNYSPILDDARVVRLANTYSHFYWNGVEWILVNKAIPTRISKLKVTQTGIANPVTIDLPGLMYHLDGSVITVDGLRNSIGDYEFGLEGDFLNIDRTLVLVSLGVDATVFFAKASIDDSGSLNKIIVKTYNAAGTLTDLEGSLFLLVEEYL